MVSESVRISFSKTGRLKYISHLDLCRTMQTAMIRAKIPLRYTEGFNPHPKMIFTQPLPLFAESECELLDIRLTEDMPHEEICARLRKEFADGLYINKVYEPLSKFGEISYALYKITGFESARERELEELLSGEIAVKKKTKDGKEKVIDIRPLVRSLDRREDALEALLGAAPDSYLNPDTLCRSMCERGLGKGAYGILRIGWYRGDMSPFE